MYSESVIKIPKRGPGGPPSAHTATQAPFSPAKSTLGRRKQRESDVFGQFEEQDPRTPTRPRRKPEEPPEVQMDSDSETEARTAVEAEAIVVYQLENLRRELQQFSDHHAWGACALEHVHAIAKKFMPELIAAGEKRQADGYADSARALQETAELRSTVKDLAKAVTALAARQETKPATDGESNRGPSESSGAKSVLATGPVYKPIKANTILNKVPAQHQQTIPRSPKDQYYSARLIVILRGEKFDTASLNPHQLVNLINNRLSHSKDAKHLCVASAHYNYNQNLVIMMREDQKGEELRQHVGEFIDIFGVLAHIIEMLTDDRRYKVRINGVWTGRDGEDNTHTPDDLLEEIERFNLVMSKVKLIGKPRWLRAEADLRQKDYSSVVLEFAKEDDAKMVLAAGYIAMYTKFCETVHHADRPPVLQCSKCWTLRHHVSRCKQLTRCRLCAGEHSETEHQQKDFQRMLEDTENGDQAEDRHPKCANCGGDHPAMERKCPERKRYQMLARERENGGAAGRAVTRRRKGGKMRVEEPSAKAGTYVGNNKGEQQTGNQTAETGAKPTDAQDKGEKAKAGPAKNANRFMSLENLLNEEGEGLASWADDEMEGQEETDRPTNGNVPSS